MAEAQVKDAQDRREKGADDCSLASSRVSGFSLNCP